MIFQVAEEISPVYRVLARKYRPQTFSQLIGQETLIRTLDSAFRSHRIAHAFLLTGIRGIGKTTTARIIAKGLNCTGDGNTQPTMTPCGICADCTAIMDGTHIDVMEIDAASRTGVGDIREIIDSVRYKPVQARTRVFIIDEVHMLSRSAFNALLKTLEEPPAHVKFIFATTDPDKIPITVHSRCQHYPLKPLSISLLADHLASVCQQENVSADNQSLSLIAHAADGSVRDSLSLLDQAIAYTSANLNPVAVQEMLGLCDIEDILTLFEHIFSGNTASAFEEAYALRNKGIDTTTWITQSMGFLSSLLQLKVGAGDITDRALLTGQRADRIKGLLDNLSVAHLGRAWSLLSKSYEELHLPAEVQVFEMAILRLLYTSNLPSVHSVVEAIKLGNTQGEGLSGGINTAESRFVPQSSQSIGSSALSESQDEKKKIIFSGNVPSANEYSQEKRTFPTAPVSTKPENKPQSSDVIETYDQLITFLQENKELRLKTLLEKYAHLVEFKPMDIAIRFDKEFNAIPFVKELKETLYRLINQHWVITLSDEQGEDTIFDQKQQQKQELRKELMKSPLVKAAFDAFPSADILQVQDLTIEMTAINGVQATTESGVSDPESFEEEE